MTGCNDPFDYGEGFITAFRELKPGTVDAMFEAFYPVRWCTFAEPVSVYRGSKVRLEAVLANEDSAPPGKYPARLQVVGPDNRKIFDRPITVTIPGRENGKEPPFAIPVFSEDVPIDGPSGKYRFLVTFQKGVAAAGGETEFYVTDPAEMPPVETDVALWGNDPELAAWLNEHGIKLTPISPGESGRHTPGDSRFQHAGRQRRRRRAWRDLATRIAQGSTAIFLSFDVFKKGGQSAGLAAVGQRKARWGWCANTRSPKSIRRTNGRRDIRCSTACPAAG